MWNYSNDTKDPNTLNDLKDPKDLKEEWAAPTKGNNALRIIRAMGIIGVM